jgi:hypothetical protein
MKPMAMQGVFWGLPEVPRPCCVCRVVKPAECFSRRRGTTGVRCAECRQCHHERLRHIELHGTSAGFAVRERVRLGGTERIERRKSLTRVKRPLRMDAAAEEGKRGRDGAAAALDRPASESGEGKELLGPDVVLPFPVKCHVATPKDSR